MNLPLTGQNIDKLARRRARRKMGWYIHALVFLMVNLGLALLAAYTGRPFAVFPAFGWGLGLLIHGMVVFLLPPGGAKNSPTAVAAVGEEQHQPWP